MPTIIQTKVWSNIDGITDNQILVYDAPQDPFKNETAAVSAHC